MRFIIHVGPQKTGTTYLQNTLYALRERLAASGIAYGTSVDGFSVRLSRRSDMGEALRQTPVPDIAREFASVRAHGHHALIISSELLAQLPLRQLIPLREAVGRAEVQIVFYCRRWSDRLPSLWAQFVASGAAATFPDWYLRTLLRADTISYVNEAIVWQIWADLFGRDALQIVSYDVLREARIDLAQDFLASVLGWSGDATTDPRRIGGNERVAPIETELSRALNAMAGMRGETVQLSARVELLRALRREGIEPFRTLLAPAHATIRLDDAAPALAASAATMQAWSDRVSPRAGDGRLMMPAATLHEFYDPAWLTLPSAQVMLLDFFGRLHPQPVRKPGG